MTEAGAHKTIDRSHISPVTTREELIYLLSRACELEHGLACIYLFAAYSLKSDVQEGGVTEEQLPMIREWKRHLARVAAEEMLHLAQVCNMLTAIGGAPNFRRTNFPLPASAYPFGIALTLEPFSTRTIERFVAYEMPEEGVLPESDHKVYAEIRARVLESQEDQLSTPQQAMAGLEPFEIDFSTVGDFYHKIETGFWNLPVEDLFIGPTEAQANGRFIDLGGDLHEVLDRDAASAAIEMIVEQGEAPTSDHPDCHFNIFDNIRKEYEQAQQEAAEAGGNFEPVRPVAFNPMTRFYDDTSMGNVIVDPLTHDAADLFNVAYDTMLAMLMRFFAHTEESDAELKHLSRTCLRIMTSVLRPLSEALTKMPIDSVGMPGRTAGPGFGYNRDVHLLPHKESAWKFFGERLWELAKASTRLRVNPEVPPEIHEVAAALQDLACQFASEDGHRSTGAMVDELRSMEAGLEPAIQPSWNGPYLVTNIELLESYLGEPIPARPQMALCRCGGSQIKPFCDGTHARIGFTGAKDPARAPDRRDAYEGREVTILDNRGICQHSGYCTDRLASVFKLRQEPWIDPNGDKMSEIVRAVRACPSGALSYAIEGEEQRERVDQQRPPKIEVSKDGPYRVTGGVKILDGHGNDELRAQGSSMEHYALCRCGSSQNKPFCSGMHWYVDFLDPEPVAGRNPTPFEWLGGLPALNLMTSLFYEKYVPDDPILGPRFEDGSADRAPKMAAWMGEALGGPPAPPDEGEGSWARHLPSPMSEEERARWVSLMLASADGALLPADAEFRSALVSWLEWASRVAASTSGADGPYPDLPSPQWSWGPAGPPVRQVEKLVESVMERVVLPGPDEVVSFEQHIRHLFPAADREALAWEFDLWSYEDVVRNCVGILERIRAGSLPADGNWSEERTECFVRWMESGQAL